METFCDCFALNAHTPFYRYKEEQKDALSTMQALRTQGLYGDPV